MWAQRRPTMPTIPILAWVHVAASLDGDVRGVACRRERARAQRASGRGRNALTTYTPRWGAPAVGGQENTNIQIVESTGRSEIIQIFIVAVKYFYLLYSEVKYFYLRIFQNSPPVIYYYHSSISSSATPHTVKHLIREMHAWKFSHLNYHPSLAVFLWYYASTTKSYHSPLYWCGNKEFYWKKYPRPQNSNIFSCLNSSF